MCLSTASGPLRALIADDQIEVREALRLLLKGNGFQLEVAESPPAVMEALRSGVFDVVLMDLNYARDTTSGEEGLDLLSRILALDHTLPVVVMTGWGSVELAVEAMRRGVRDFVQKPWENDRLLAILRRHAEEGRIVRKRRHLEAEKERLGEAMMSVKDRLLLPRLVAEHLQRALLCETVVVFTRSSRDQMFWATAQVGLTDEIIGRLRFEPGSALLARLEDLCDPRSADLPESEKILIRMIRSSLLVPLRLKGVLIGFVGLGGREAASEIFDPLELEFLSGVATLIGADIEKLSQRVQAQEFEEAREIQEGLLPQAIPEIPGAEIQVVWQPASAVGGDYFDVLRLSDSSVALLVADVVGKGMPAALLMSNLQAAVRAFASESMPPRDLCSKVNRILFSNIASNKFISFFYCVHDTRAGRLVYCNAGHNPPILLKRDGLCERLRTGGVVLGVLRDGLYEQCVVEFGPGDRLVLYTDGVTEARNSRGEEFGEERLEDLLCRHRRLNAAGLQKAVMVEVADFSGGEFHDDATLIVLAGTAGSGDRREAQSMTFGEA